MNRLLKIIAYSAIAIVLSYIANISDREFIKGFSSNIISLLTTILAINIPTSTLIVSEINRIKNKIDIQTEPTFEEIVILICLFIIQIICNYISGKMPLFIFFTNLISDAFAIAAFLYYIEIIYDLGIALFNLISYKTK